METISRKSLTDRIRCAVFRAKSLSFDGEPAENATIVTDAALAEILGVTKNTVQNWRKTKVLVNYKKQSERVIIYKLKKVIADLERHIK